MLSFFEVVKTHFLYIWGKQQLKQKSCRNLQYCNGIFFVGFSQIVLDELKSPVLCGCQSTA